MIKAICLKASLIMIRSLDRYMLILFMDDKAGPNSENHQSMGN